MPLDGEAEAPSRRLDALDDAVLRPCRWRQAGGDPVEGLVVVAEHGVARPDQGVECAARRRADRALDLLIGPGDTVHCHHHQALDRIAAGLTPSAWAEDDVVEGVEAAGRRFCLAVQWHPEAGEERRLFEGLVAAAG